VNQKNKVNTKEPKTQIANGMSGRYKKKRSLKGAKPAWSNKEWQPMGEHACEKVGS